MKTFDKCPFCSFNKLQLHSLATYWLKIELKFVECIECGLIFTNPMPEMDLVIKGNSILFLLHRSKGTLSKYRGGKEYSIYLKRKMNKGTMLDVGCGDGIWLYGVEDNCEWKAEGVEITESAVKFANNKLRVKVHLGTLDTIKNRENYYDHIRLNNVIEHVQDPVVFLKKTNSLLKKGGTVYCSTPNGIQDGSVLKIANKRGFKINLLENHFYYYPPKTLREIFKSCGFKITHAYSEDISHVLKDFGITDGIKDPGIIPEHNLDYYEKIPDVYVDLDLNEVKSCRNHYTVKNWRILFTYYQMEIFRFRFPWYIPLGHQQHVYAKKI
jgi:2-polyprenyl-3-methyl-5-hydroxy-6-metoxy-1,4-benzoquinol methylase